MNSSYNEDHLVEQPAIKLMQHELGWDVVNCYGEWDGGVSALGRDGKREVVLVSRLRPALQRLNPDLPVEAIEGAVEEKFKIPKDSFRLAFVCAMWLKMDLPQRRKGRGGSKRWRICVFLCVPWRPLRLCGELLGEKSLRGER